MILICKNDKVVDNIVVTEKDIKLIGLIWKGLSNKEISPLVHLSVRTIETARMKMIKITNSKNIIGLIKWAIENEIIKH